MKHKVFCIGAHKTGTTSLEVALRKLGYRVRGSFGTKDPDIARRVRVFWHGRTRWPDKCWNFNAYNDLKAVRVVFTSDLPLILFDTGTYLRCPMEESARRILPHGALGRYLHEFRLQKPWFQSPTKGFITRTASSA